MHYMNFRSFYKCCWVTLLPFIFYFILSFIVCFSTLFASSPYTTKELDDLEKEFVQLINQSDQIERNPLANEYINHLGKRLAHFAEIPTPHFFVVKSNEINAFAGPGGYIGVNTQLILASDNESELAAVMAHEMAHVRLHHLYRMIEHQKQMQIPKLASILAALALGVINPALGNGALMATLGGFAQGDINFTRSNEKEADRIGMDMLAKAGFDPKGMSSFFKKMQQSTRYYYTSHVPAILRTHPLDDERIAEAENRIALLKKSFHQSSLHYQLFKELIRVAVANNNQQLLEFYQYQNKDNPVSNYGRALTLISINNYSGAIQALHSLLQKDPNNLFYQIALTDAKLGNNEFESALKQLKELYANYPENYAVTMAYAKGLLASEKANEAVKILLQGSRRFKDDLTLCGTLARAQATANKPSYAYFTQAQCHLLQGQRKEAIRQLKWAKKLSKKDNYLQARIDALLEELTTFSS